MKMIVYAIATTTSMPCFNDYPDVRVDVCCTEDGFPPTFLRRESAEAWIKNHAKPFREMSVVELEFRPE